MPTHTVIVISKPGVPHLEVLQELPPGAKLVVGNTVEALAPAIAEADVIFNANFNREPFRTLFPQAPHVKWVHSLSAGVEAMLYPPLIESPVPLTNARGVFRDSLAEFAIAGMLFFAKDLRRMVRSQESSKWDPFDIEMLEDATLGVVGYGEIGQRAAQLARAMGMKVLALRRRTSETPDSYGPGQLHEMLALCDYVLVAAPNTPETTGMIGAAEFAKMKPNAVIMNVGRGPVIDETALIQALESRRIKGAVLDVFNTEPLPVGHPFYRLDNVLMSAHCADHTSDWIHRAMRKFVENYVHFDRGEPLDNIVDKKAGY